MKGHIAIVVFTVLLLSAMVTVCTFDTWQTALLVTLLMIVTSYVMIFSMDHLTSWNMGSIHEGFVVPSAAEESKYEWLSNDDLFDDFYASVFTKLTQNGRKINSAFWMQDVELEWRRARLSNRAQVMR